MTQPDIHIRDGRADRHARTNGTGSTWCGKKLLGTPEATESGNEAFTSYGNRIEVTLAPGAGTCSRCREAFDAAFAAAFPDGPKPIATFRTDSPEDLARAKSVLGVDALNRFFGPGGGGMAAFEQALRDSSGKRSDV